MDMLDVVQCTDVLLRPYRAGIAFERPHTDATNLNRDRRGRNHVASHALLALSAGAGETGVFSMCDYSLEDEKSRPATVGEKLRTHRFNTGTIGFASLEDTKTAVCVLPGTELAFATAVSLGWFGWKSGIIKHTAAIFRQVNKHYPRMHHDALEFPDGQVALLTDLVEGQEATVLQLPAQPLIAAEIKAQERAPHI